MNCTSCSNPLPAGVAFCPTCGAATPYNTPGQGPASPYDQTEASSPYGSAPNYSSLPPTIAANADNYGGQQPSTPYTNYGAPQQGAYNPYNTPASSYPADAPPPPANPMGSAPYYGTPQNYGGGTPPMYPQGMQQPGMYGVPPKKKSKVGLIIGISLLAVVLLCGGLIVAAAQLGKNTASKLVSSIDATATAVANDTSNTGNSSTTSNVPSSNDVDPAAAKILTAAQTSDGVNTDYQPTHITSTFATDKDVDLTFQVNSAGKDGYIEVKWYQSGQQVHSDILQHHAQNDHGYFGYSFTSSGDSVGALYWCTKADCSDEQLAQVVKFTVTGSTSAIPSHNAIATTAISTRRFW